jgi:hypothetical protein
MLIKLCCESYASLVNGPSWHTNHYKISKSLLVKTWSASKSSSLLTSVTDQNDPNSISVLMVKLEECWIGCHTAWVRVQLFTPLLLKMVEDHTSGLIPKIIVRS